ncbi:MAG TPA: acetate/propionate family kinase, partial [Acetobacteraceae bacterium]
MQDRRLCVLNAGSSSLKFAVFGAGDDGLPRLQSGEIERIGGSGRMLVSTPDGKALHDRMVETKDHAAALALLAALPDGPLDRRALIGFGHRVVHGGPDMA